MVALPLLASRRWPRLAGFDRTWLPRRWRHLLWALGVLALVTVCGGTIGYLTQRFDLRQGLPYLESRNLNVALLSPAWVLFAAFSLVIIGPVAEEILWRGYALEQFEKVMPRSVALFVQAFLFSASHLGRLYVGAFLGLLGYGLIVGLWRQRMRSLVPLIVIHVALSALATIPSTVETYQQAKMLELLDDDFGIRADMEDTFREIRENPRAREIDRLARKPADVAVPALIQFLGDEEEAIRLYATSRLRGEYKAAACPYYGEALDSDDPEIVDGVLMLIFMVECRELLPKVRRVILEAPSLELATSGTITLDWLGDWKGLEQIAAQHPMEKVRQAAERKLEMRGEQ
jgi:membrane protease YdiL (CAAX protease family)